MIITCIKNCWVDSIYYRVGDTVNITERQFLPQFMIFSEHYVHNGHMFPKEKFLTIEELRDYKIKKICVSYSQT
jgi:hypothetical protein